MGRDEQTGSHETAGFHAGGRSVCGGTRPNKCAKDTGHYQAIYHVAEPEAGKLKGEIEVDDAYFGGRRSDTGG